MKNVLVIDTERDGYTVNQVGYTMTVGDLRDYLNSYPDDMEIFLSFDNRYTFGSVQKELFHEIVAGEE